MKKLIASVLTVGLMTGIGAGLYANHPGKDGKHGEKRIERMKTELDLTADQEAKIRAVFEKQKEKMKALHEETHKEVSAILTAEQRQKFEEMKEKRRERMEKHRDHE